MIIKEMKVHLAFPGVGSWRLSSGYLSLTQPAAIASQILIVTGLIVFAKFVIACCFLGYNYDNK